MMISIEELQSLIKADIQGLQTEVCQKALLDAVGCVLAEDVRSQLDIPNAPVSAMDGYGFFSKEETEEGASFTVIGQSIAGKAFSGEIQEGQCIRIMTGAVVPSGVNTVVMQENVTREGDQIVLMKKQSIGQNVRHQGEEVKSGDRVLSSGHLLTITDVPLLASLGLEKVSVFSKVRVALFSTGDELLELGQPMAQGHIYDSNRPTIKALLSHLPVEVIDLGIVKDSLESIKEALSKASSYDVIVTSGGVSVGDYDFLKEALLQLGEIVSYKVAMKPGKPFVYGKIGRARYFGLPGNPLSSLVAAKLFLIPAIYQALGTHLSELSVYAKLTHGLSRRTTRAELQRGCLQQDHLGQWVVNTQFKQDSHRVHQLSLANSFVFLPAEQTVFKEGEIVKVFPFDGKFI